MSEAPVGESTRNKWEWAEEVLKEILCIHQLHYIGPLICDVLSSIPTTHLPFWDGSVKPREAHAVHAVRQTAQALAASVLKS